MPTDDDKASIPSRNMLIAVVVTALIFVLIFAFGIHSGNIQVNLFKGEFTINKDDLQACLEDHWTNEKEACIGTIAEWSKKKNYVWGPRGEAVLLEDRDALKQAGFASIRNPDFDLIRDELISFQHCDQFGKVARVAEECQNRTTPKIFEYTATFDHAPAEDELRVDHADDNFSDHYGDGCTINLKESPRPDASISVWVGKRVGLQIPNRVQLRDDDFVRLISLARHQQMPERSSSTWNKITAIGAAKVELHCFQIHIDP
jgi:hypothetical protein